MGELGELGELGESIDAELSGLSHLSQPSHPVKQRRDWQTLKDCKDGDPHKKAPAPAAEPRRPQRPGYSVGVAPLVMLIWVMAGLLIGWLGMLGASQAMVMAGIVMLSPFGLAAALLIGALLRQQRKQRLG